MNFGEFLRWWRIEKGMTIRQLSSYTGCTESYLSLLERGRRGKKGPSPSILKSLAVPLGIPYELLLQKAGYPPLAGWEPYTASRSVIHILRESMGLSQSQFAARAKISLDVAERMEGEGVPAETVERACRVFFAHRRALTPYQNAIILKVEEVFATFPSQASLVMEKMLGALLEVEPR